MRSLTQKAYQASEGWGVLGLLFLPKCSGKVQCCSAPGVLSDHLRSVKNVAPSSNGTLAC